MDSDSLVPHLDPFQDCRARLIVRAEVLVVDKFRLQGRPEAFHHGVVVAVASTAHALRHAPREVLDMHDMHVAHHDRGDGPGQSVETSA